METPFIFRQLARFAPLIIIVAIFGAPLLIWSVKSDPSPIRTERMNGRVVAVVPEGQEPERVTVELEDGSRITLTLDDLPPDVRRDMRLLVVKTTDADGDVDYDVEPAPATGTPPAGTGG
ncbi:MAG: hypothetical protein WBA44_02935 [Mesorhizobium sp.]